LLKEKNETILGVKSNIPGLDKAVENFKSGELIVISGFTKHGKTLLAQSFTYEFEKQNYFSLWFSFEVPQYQFIGQFQNLPLFYLPLKLRIHAMDWLEQCILKSFEKYNTRIIFIDHLHYLFDIARTRNPSIEIGTIIRKLKTIAVNNGFLIFLLCHTRKAQKSSNDLSFESIRDSSFVSQESDCVLMIQRNIKDIESKTAWLKIEFHRRTGIFNQKVKLIKVDGYLKQIEEQHG